MKKLFLSIVSAASAMVLTSCFQHEVTVTLNKDGSGTVVEESRMGGQMLAMLAQMAAGFGGEEGAVANDPLKDMLSEEKANIRAAELGEGVTLVKIEPVEAGDAKGARATYRFADINKLKLDVGAGMNSLPTAPGQEQEKKENPIGFDYKDGKLTIKMPKPEKGEKGEEAEEIPDDPESMEMMKQVFGDMKMSIKFVLADGIEETNATHRDENTLTLMEMDFGKVVANPESLKKLAATQGEEDPALVMDALKDIDGIKVEAQPEVTVTMK